MKLWDNFCPLFDWVAPEVAGTTGNGYLKKYWNRETSIHAINFRQFAFLSTDFDLGSGNFFDFFHFFIKTNLSDSLYYHCHIKVCPKNEETTCSKKDMSNVENTCTAPTYYNAAVAGGSRRRRDNIITRRQSGSFSGPSGFRLLFNYVTRLKPIKYLDGSTSFEIVQKVSTPDVAPDDCQTIDGNVCIAKKDERAESTSSKPTTSTKSSAVIAGSSLATFIALLNLH